ncbi:MAG TPA: glycosyltransferase family 2 protein [Acidobacteria bacterium]|nr:glycosyltransferase family 2 protein [Acidobacteriota bacterium]
MISAIVVVYNGAGWLERCLASVVAGGPEVETLVVDNASTDGSQELVASRFPGAVLLPQESNLGFGAAVNLAAGRARGEALLLLNQDAWLEAGALERMAARLGLDGRTGLVAPQLRYPDGSPQFSWSPARSVAGEALQRFLNRHERSAWVHGGAARAVARLAGPLWYTAACLLLRKEAFQAVGGFDERFFLYFEDVDLCLRLGAAGWRMVREPGAVVTHGGGLRAAGTADDAYRTAQLLFYQLHRPAWERRVLERRLRRRFGDATVERWRAAVAEVA